MADMKQHCLGAFFAVMRPLMRSTFTHDQTGFMKDFFDQIEPGMNGSAEKKSFREKQKTRKTAILNGVWEGTSESSLPKYYSGERRIPKQRARVFARGYSERAFKSCLIHMNRSQYESAYQQMVDLGLQIDDYRKVPQTASLWLKRILDAYSNGDDYNPAERKAVQPTLDIPAGNMRIIDGRLFAGNKSLPWPAASVPAKPKPNEGIYIRQMFAAYGEHFGHKITSDTDLDPDDRAEFERQRGYFYDAEQVKTNCRDAVDKGDEQFGEV